VEGRFWILDFGFWILDFGFWILDFGFWILDFGLKIIYTSGEGNKRGEVLYFIKSTFINN
jgi:hypothetical protein